MTQTQLLLAVTILQQGFFALLWAACAAMRLSRRASVHWGIASVVLALSQTLIVQRADLGLWTGGWLPNLLNMIAFALVRRGVQVFTRKVPTDGEQVVVIIIGAGGVALALMGWVPEASRAIFSSLAMAWIILRCAGEIVSGARDEFGPTAALACAAQVFIAGVVIGARPLAAFVGGHASTPSVQVATGFNVGLLLTFVALGFMLMSSLVGLVVARMVVRLRRLSLHDPLTQVLNRRGLEGALDLAYARLRRSGKSVALLLIDIDHFKVFNDRYGHAVGDAVLVGVAGTLLRQCRGMDAVGRMGGEEFAVLLPDTQTEGALAVAERIREAVASDSCAQVPAGERVTVSVGAAVLNDAGEGVDTLWRRVDAAMYAAKRAGRNVVHLADDPGPRDERLSAQLSAP